MNQIDENTEYKDVEIISDYESIDNSSHDETVTKPSFKILQKEFLSLFITVLVLFGAIFFFIISVIFKSDNSKLEVQNPEKKFSYSLKVDLNSADPVMLELLPEIGPIIAKKIIEYREENGGFKSVDELAKIKGISLRMVNTLRPFVFVNPADNLYNQ